MKLSLIFLFTLLLSTTTYSQKKDANIIEV